jgi:hypothetical protein
LHQKVDAPASEATLHGNALFAGMLLQQSQSKAVLMESPKTRLALYEAEKPFRQPAAGGGNSSPVNLDCPDVQTVVNQWLDRQNNGLLTHFASVSAEGSFSNLGCQGLISARYRIP